MSAAFFRHFPLADARWRALLDGSELQEAQQQVLQRIDPVACLPPADLVFAALDATPLAALRVLIVGQDPYPTPGDAHGLSFSVAHGKQPRSLVNIFTEIERDCGGPRRSNANLQDWAAVGVLLLNRVLTTPPKEAGGHRRCGWEALTAAVVSAVAQRPGPLVVLLWGNDAATVAPLFTPRDDLLVLRSGHPSPLAYNRASANSFRECGHFAAANTFLQAHGCPAIPWRGIT